VKARRAAIDTARQTLDAATSQQATAQKEVVALLERKHSWSNGDLERYMSLIRSEHVNDQAVTEAKEAVFAAESALEEARTRLEKRERAQYHEEQIWSDTIRRNSTWVTFGLMGVNIFLLLLSLLIFEPWRRRRIVREIKSALEAQKVATAVTPVSAAMPPAAAIAMQDRASIEAEIDKPMELMPTPPITARPALSEAAIIESSRTDTNHSTRQTPTLVEQSTPESMVKPVPDPAVPGAAPLISIGAGTPSQDSINITKEALRGHEVDSKADTWRDRISWVAHDIVSDRVFSMRRVDFTTAILQSAAAGAVIAAALIAMIRRT
jgi:sensitive to high expression protein 9